MIVITTLMRQKELRTKCCQRHNGPMLSSLYNGLCNWSYLPCWFQIWPPGLALVPNLTTRWCHLYRFQICPPGGATCIGSKFGHQMAPLAVVKTWPPESAICLLTNCATSLFGIVLLLLASLVLIRVGIFISQSNIS